jgi:HlyD family secretion protein
MSSTDLISAAPPISIDDDPAKDARAGAIAVGTFAALFLGWAGLAPLDAAATASGQISISGHSQIVQHREGGVVSAVDVAEGQHVKAGQVLMELAPEDVGAQVMSLRAGFISLQAQRARLMAELQDSPQIEWPASFAALTGDDLAAAKEAMRVQQAQFDAGTGALRAQEAINARKAAGLGEQITGSQAQLASISQQQTLLDQQLQGTQSLAAKGYASLNSVQALQRASADLAGSHQQTAANIADYRQQIAAAQLETSNLVKQRSMNAADALRETEDQLATLTPKLDAARFQLARGTLRAQTDGVVSGLTVFTAGTVVAPGQKLMEVVPDHQILIVDARIAAPEIEGVHVGQAADVRLISPGARGMPILRGSLTELSADSVTDDKSGQVYYTAQITVPKNEFDLTNQDNNGNSVARPGMPVEVMIPLHKRSAFEYLFGPLTQALWQSFRQR